MDELIVFFKSSIFPLPMLNVINLDVAPRIEELINIISATIPPTTL